MPRKAHPAPAHGRRRLLLMDGPRQAGCRYAAVALVVSFHAVVPWAATTGSHARRCVTTAYSWRRMAPATAVWAWVGVSRWCSRLVRCLYRAAYTRFVCRHPHTARHAATRNCGRPAPVTELCR